MITLPTRKLGLKPEIELYAQEWYRVNSSTSAYPYPLADIHSAPICDRVSGYIVSRLAENGHRAGVAWAEYLDQLHPRLAAQISPDHAFVVALNWSGYFVADPSWQQFLPPAKKYPHLPKVLFGRPQRAVHFAIEAGVDSALAELWLPDCHTVDLRR